MTFRELYLQHWDGFEAYRRSQPTISPPLLVNPPDSYWRQPFRLCVVGQETHSWYDEPFGERTGAAAIDYLLNIYQNDFAMGMRYNSPFWSAVRQIESNLGLEPGAVVWTNLNKVDQNMRRPSPDVEKAVREIFPVVADEICLARPDAVVLFTGPRYDGLLKTIFPSAILTPVTPFLSSVEHEALPPKSVRSYHPSYLRRRKVLEETIVEIVRLIRGT